MRIGIMLRTLGEQGGIGVYTRYITEELLALDRRNDYVLYYRDEAHRGRFAHHENAVERVLRAPNKAAWDQIAVPLACRRDSVDVIFHPKFTVPLAAPAKSVMVLHGAGWFMAEFSHFWPARDLRYARLMMPRYCRRAAAVISVSQITTETFNQTFNLPEEKIRTVYFGPGRQFKRVEQPERLAEVKRKYDLPDHFIFTLTGYERGPRKNIAGLLRAYELTHGQTGHRLVIGGKECHRFKTDFAIPDEGYGQDVLFPGWIAQEDLPAVYSLADLFLYPSRVEAFPIPITEALACGTPIVTSNANGLRELAGGAAVLVDPDRPEEIAAAVTRVLTDAALRADLSARGLARAAAFTWDRCARETLAILEEVAKEEVERANVD